MDKQVPQEGGPSDKFPLGSKDHIWHAEVIAADEAFWRGRLRLPALESVATAARVVRDCLRDGVGVTNEDYDALDAALSALGKEAGNG